MIKLNSFLDSNVILNYIFSLEKHHVKSEEIIFNSVNYYSPHVEDEVDEVFIKKNKRYKSFVLGVDEFINKFSDQDLVNNGIVHGFIDNLRPIGKFKRHEMHEAFDRLWVKFDLDETHDAFEVKLKFNKFADNFQLLHQKRKDFLYSQMILVPNHTKKDRQISDLIKTNCLRDELLHENDEDILFDAHEFAKNNNELDLRFVTADKDFFKAINILIDYLSFDKCINLMEFSNSYNISEKLTFRQTQYLQSDLSSWMYFARPCRKTPRQRSRHHYSCRHRMDEEAFLR